MSNSFIMTESIVRPAKMPYGRLKDNSFVGIEGEHAARALVVETKDDLSAFASVNLIIDDLDCGAMTKTISGSTTTLSMTLTSSMIGRSGRKICQLIMVNSGNTVVQKSSQFEAYVGRANEIERSVDDGVTIIILSEAVTEMAQEAAAAAAQEAVADVVADCQAIADAASASADAAAQSASDAQTAAASIVVDSALDATSTHALQNKVVTSEINALKADLDAQAESIEGIKLISNPMAVDALLACFRNVAWINNQGQECYDNLVKAVNGVNPVYEIPGGTDISTLPINTGISVFGKNEYFTILAKLRLKVWPTERTMGLLVNDRYVSNGTLRLGTEYENGLLRFVTNVMYGDLTTGYVISANVSHDIKWVVRVKDKIVTKILYIDNQQYVNKVEDITSYMDARTFEGNYYVSGINLNSSQNTYPAVIELFRIYDCALDDSYIESVMDINA